LNPEAQSELAELFAAGQKAVENADIRRLDSDGYIAWLAERATELKEAPIGQGKDARASWKLRDKLNPWEKVFNITFTVRGHIGICAVKEHSERVLEQLAEQHPELFSEPRTPAHFQQWRDPKEPLRNLAIARLVQLLGFKDL
jgi:hypothetical protein